MRLGKRTQRTTKARCLEPRMPKLHGLEKVMLVPPLKRRKTSSATGPMSYSELERDIWEKESLVEELNCSTGVNKAKRPTKI